MEAQGLIAEAELAGWWGVDQSTFLALRKAGGIVADVPGGVGTRSLYSLATLNAFHERQARHCRARLPRAADLAVGTRRLLTVREAAERIGCSEYDMYYAVNQGHVGSIQLSDEGSQVRIPDTELADYLKRRNNPEAIPFTDAIKVLCSSRTTLRPHVGTALHVVAVPHKLNQVHVSRESLIAFMATRLAEDVDAEWWLGQQLEHLDEGWLSVEGMRAAHHLSKKLMMVALVEGRLLGIREGNRQWHIPQWAVRLYLHQNRVLTAPEVAALLGVKAELAEHWIQTRALCRLKHTRAHCPKLSCIESYLVAHRLSETIDTQAWLGVCEDTDDRVLTLDTLANHGIDESDMLNAVRSGWTQGVQLPPDQSGRATIALLNVTPRLMRSYLRLAERRLSGGDYEPTYLY